MNVVPPGTEALDDPNTDPALVVRMLRDIARTNRWLGGRAVVERAMSRLVDANDRGRTLTLLDVGTGLADLPASMVQWSAERGITLRAVGLERIPAAARAARDSGVPTMLGCASALPLRAQSIDVVLVSQVVHHLSDVHATALLSRATIAARRGVIVADLHPSRMAELGFTVAGTAFGLHRTTIADGVTSLRRGFRPERLRALCESAQPHRVHVMRGWGSRIAAWWRTC